MAILNRRSLAAIVGTGAAAGLLAFTPKYEGTVYHTYRDMGGVLTYCTGATENAQWGKTYTPAQCRAQLDSDLAKHAEEIRPCFHHFDQMTEGQKIAFVDTAYNAGSAGVCRSSMARYANAGNMKAACAALSTYRATVHGQPVNGLIRRRAAVRAICEGRKA